jgi:hypothetical protein
MTKRKKILSGILALIIGCSVAIPLRASADDRDHDRARHEVRVDRDHDHAWRDHDRDWRDHDHDRAWRDRDWRWDRYEDHYRAYPYAPGYAYGANGYIRPNGQGMINPRNPNLYWACDSDGHHCHWAPRF